MHVAFGRNRLGQVGRYSSEAGQHPRWSVPKGGEMAIGRQQPVPCNKTPSIQFPPLM